MPFYYDGRPCGTGRARSAGQSGAQGAGQLPPRHGHPRSASCYSQNQNFRAGHFRFRSSSKRHRVGIPIQRVPTTKERPPRLSYEIRRLPDANRRAKVTRGPPSADRVNRFDTSAYAGPPKRAASVMRRGLGRCPQRASECLPPSFGPPARWPGFLQPVPREGTRSACTPGLADGQGFTRNCARGPLL